MKKVNVITPKKVSYLYFCNICGNNYNTEEQAVACFDKCASKTNRCCFCSKEIKYDPQWGFFDGATQFKIGCSYGSTHDGQSFTMIVCDDCLKVRYNENLS